MEIIDLEPDLEPTFLCCLKDYDEGFKQGVPRKLEWLDRARGRGLRVKLARDDDGAVAGMVQYVPLDLAPHVAGGQGTWVILCIWVHRYGQGIGDRGGRGLGPALLRAAEEDMRARGASGIAAWGITDPEWMNVPWFESQGYRSVEVHGWYGLVWKALAEGAGPPRWIVERKRPAPVPGRVRVSSFEPGWCPSGNLIQVWARRAARELGERVMYEEYDTSDPAVVEEWGISSGLFVDGDELPIAGDETYEKVRTFIERRLEGGEGAGR